eukprot:9010768-Pyramimonas_sp.AAC.1
MSLNYCGLKYKQHMRRRPPTTRSTTAPDRSSSRRSTMPISSTQPGYVDGCGKKVGFFVHGYVVGDSWTIRHGQWTVTLPRQPEYLRECWFQSVNVNPTSNLNPGICPRHSCKDLDFKI